MSDNLPAQVHQSSNAVATVNRPGVGIGALTSADIRLPRMKFAQMISKVVGRGLVPYGAIYVVTSQDDEEPTILRDAAKMGELTKPLRFYVIGVTPNWSYTQPDGQLGRSLDGNYPDLALVKEHNPKFVRRTYDYTISLPEYPDLPVSFLMHGKWGGQSSKSMNTRLTMTRTQGIESYELPFKLQGRKIEDSLGAYMQAVVGVDKVAAKDKAKDQELVEEHLTLIGGGNVQVVEESEAPGYVPQPVGAGAPSLD